MAPHPGHSEPRQGGVRIAVCCASDTQLCKELTDGGDGTRRERLHRLAGRDAVPARATEGAGLLSSAGADLPEGIVEHCLLFLSPLRLTQLERPLTYGKEIKENKDLCFWVLHLWTLTG